MTDWQAEDMIGAARLARGVYWGRAWSLVGGCTHVSPGCARCWAEQQAYRFRGKPFYAGLTDDCGHWTGEVRCREDLLDLPLRTREPTVWAVWTDLFHRAVPRPFQLDALSVMGDASRHRFLVLTKRGERLMNEMNDYCDVLPNVAFGVTTEDQGQADARIPMLLNTPAAMRFVSCEPLLGPGVLSADNGLHGGPGQVDWIIVGCESGPGRRHTRLELVRDIVRQCREAAVPCFVKQISVPRLDPEKLRGALRGFTCRTHPSVWEDMISAYGSRVSHDPSEWPVDLRVRQLPEAWLTGKRNE